MLVSLLLPLTTHANIFDSCITTARWLGVPIPRGTNAKDIKPNSYPIKNGLILFSYDNNDHVAKIVSFLTNGFWVIEGNKIAGKLTERFVSFKDPFLKGFWYPTQ